MLKHSDKLLVRETTCVRNCRYKIEDSLLCEWLGIIETLAVITPSFVLLLQYYIFSTLTTRMFLFALCVRMLQIFFPLQIERVNNW